MAPAPVVTPSPAPTALGVGPIENRGQKILARPEALDWFQGEGSSAPATKIANYRLNADSLAGSALSCTKLAAGGCTALEIIPSVHLVNGVTYTLWLLDTPLGTFVAQGLEDATPHVVSATATQYALTVRFDRPMLHTGDCGASTFSLSVPGTIAFVRGAGAFPAPAGAYTSTSPAYREFLANFVSQADVSSDCTTVTLGSGWGSVTGDVDVVIAGVEDEDGNLVEPATLPLHITDDAAPKLMFADLELQTAEKKLIRVAFSEAMETTSARDATNYRLNGAALPAGTDIQCELASCTWVRLTFAPSAFAYGSTNTISVSGMRDVAGKPIVPATSGTFQVY